jgi:hypothetical protein
VTGIGDEIVTIVRSFMDVRGRCEIGSRPPLIVVNLRVS